MAAARSFSFLGSSFALAFVGLAVTSVAAGCGSSTTYKEQVYEKSTVGPTTSGTQSCGFSPGTVWLDIGTSDGIQYSPVEDGSNLGGATVSVDCRVTPASGGFDVVAAASQTGDTSGGRVVIQGHFTDSGDQSNITVTLSNAIKGTFSASNCTVVYQNQYQGVAAGRVWGVLDCSDVSNPDQMRDCAADVEFRFENCAQ